MAAAPRSAPAVPLPSVTFDGTKYREWSTMLEVYLESQRLWGHLTGSSPCPVVSDRPVDPAFGEDGAPPTAEAMDAYLHAIDQYVAEMGEYEDWRVEEARAKQILLASMKVEFAMDLTGLPSTQAMWERAQVLYQPHSYALLTFILELASSLRQQDSSVDHFYRQLANVWSQLDSLEPAYCRNCACCGLHREHEGVLCLHQFLGRLRQEFEQLRAKLLARSPLPSQVEAVTLVRAEEIRLQGVLSSPSTILAALTATLPPTAPAANSVSAPAVGSTSQTGIAAALYCNYCKARTHNIEQ
ncbi:hypothetical protein BS78_04G115500 [Paspalum vaginatum]|nr:hypothetical protein BS78_04G115500 [Paspalum vaginatum]